MKKFAKDIPGYTKELKDVWLQKDLKTKEIRLFISLEKFGIINIPLQKNWPDMVLDHLDKMIGEL